eukprot:TRINITY_DN5369_c0_g4_i8.p3 TRINITY_DN5369_c0_g4~~TRINITY_DN5369_c0_g4_i8.p3  ORF type:complete len:165 (+),score=49.48 TRINITY_DN5369_c0_g4_i8:1437-1931(+)
MGAAPVSKSVLTSPNTNEKTERGKQTLSSYAPNLLRLQHEKDPMLANVFVPGSLPPWITPYEAKLFPSLTVALAEARIDAKEKRKNPHRIGAAWVEQKRIMDKMMQISKISEKSTPKSINNSEISKSNFSDDWLPNFGRVFNSGPRIESAQEFRSEMKLSEKGR